MTQVYIFGNPDLPMDSLPVRLLPELKKKYPELDFIVKDPNEEWEFDGEFVVLDTVVGIKEVQVFDDLASFQPPPTMTCHDYDAYTNLRWLEKLGRLPKLTIIGLPPLMEREEALEKISEVLDKSLKEL